MDTQTAGRYLDLPSARVYYEVRGSGPLLLVIGQPMTSGPFAPLADDLAADHTVVTYDPHGLGESTATDLSLPVTPEVQAGDLAHLVDAVGGAPADVFGTSGGAVAALALATHHPDRVRTVVAHEPPVTELLPDAAYIRAAVDGVEDAYRAGGSGAAWGAFVSLVMHDGPVTEAGVTPASWPPGGQDAGEDAGPPSAKQQADDETFFLRMLKPFTRYVPDVDVLRAGAPRIVVGVGASSGSEIAARSALALAERLGTSPIRLPGDHAGFMAEPAAFAQRLRAALTRPPEVDAS